MRTLILTLLLPLLSMAIIPRDGYQQCLNASNKLESPADRDSEKIRCFQISRHKTSIDACLNLARVLEHTSSTDSLILSCLSENIVKIKMPECVSMAKKLYYSDNRDRALWMCLENKPVRNSKCKALANEMTFPYNKNVALNYCLLKN